MGLKAGVDAGQLNSILDDLDADVFVAKSLENQPKSRR